LADQPCPFHPVDGGLEVRLRVTPKASRDALQGVVADTQGNGVIKIAVTAVPEDGKANAAVIKLLAKAWRLRKTDMHIVRGSTDRNKTLLIEGDGRALQTSLTTYIV
jgi:uncharacterized protein